MASDITLLIIGAGPYGLAMAAYASHTHTDYLIVGRPMDFWKSHMPSGLFLRSPSDWHIDPVGGHTIQDYLRIKNLQGDEVEPISRDFFLSYAAWFQEQNSVDILLSLVHRLDHANERFEARLEDGKTISAKHVLIAPGFRFFKNIPEELAEILPPNRYSHTCDLVDFEFLKGRGCLIIGGRQSALEWAALIHEQGAAAVHVSHRHETPRFEPSDWSWVPELVNRTVSTPDWYRKLSSEQRENISHRFWAEGRLKLEPWLGPRVNKNGIKLWPKSRVIACKEEAGGTVEVTLDSGEILAVEHVILATGYKVDISRIPYLLRGNILSKIQTKSGYPALDPYFQSNVPGLFFSSLPATQDFGPFFGFVIGAPAAAKVAGAHIKAQRFQS